jgi:hypothetical protein
MLVNKRTRTIPDAAQPHPGMPLWRRQLLSWEAVDANRRERFRALVTKAGYQLDALTKAQTGGGTIYLVRQASEDVRRTLAAIERELVDSDNALAALLVDAPLVRAALESERERHRAAQEQAEREQRERDNMTPEQRRFEELCTIASRDLETVRTIAIQTTPRDPRFERHLHQRLRETGVEMHEAINDDPSLIVKDATVAAWIERTRDAWLQARGIDDDNEEDE